MSCSLTRFIPVFAVSLLSVTELFAKDSFAPFTEIPQNPIEVYKRYDPAAEPLEVYIHSEWEEDGVTFRLVRYCICTMNGEKHHMAGIYGFPTGKKGLPGLVRNHGGGRSAKYNMVKQWALNGYAMIDLNWGGKPIYGGPGKEPWTRAAKRGRPRDPLPGSPINYKYFLRITATMRAVTFLQQQPEVDPKKIGLVGHSIGGRITFCTAAIDKRVVASAPSCMSGLFTTGPILPTKDEVLPEGVTHEMCMGTRAHIPYIDHAILFQSPSNDVVMPINRLQMAADLVPTTTYGYTHSPNICHAGTPEFIITAVLWFDQHLRGTFTVPKTPKVSYKKSGDELVVTVFPDVSREIDRVQVYYGGPGYNQRKKWRLLKGARNNDEWTVRVPAHFLARRQNIWLWANVHYPLGKEMTGADWGGETIKTDKFGISSALKVLPGHLYKQQ